MRRSRAELIAMANGFADSEVRGRLRRAGGPGGAVHMHKARSGSCC